MMTLAICLFASGAWGTAALIIGRVENEDVAARFSILIGVVGLTLAVTLLLAR